MGHIWTKKIEKEDGACVKYILAKKEDVEILVSLFNYAYDKMVWNFYFTGSDRMYELEGPRTLVPKRDI